MPTHFDKVLERLKKLAKDDPIPKPRVSSARQAHGSRFGPDGQKPLEGYTAGKWNSAGSFEYRTLTKKEEKQPPPDQH